MKRNIVFGAALCMIAPTAQATTYLLDFDPTVACSSSCTDSSEILQTYGDQPGVDVVYDGEPATPGLQNFLYWSTGYSGLDDIAYYAGGATLSFVAASGYQVGLQSLTLGAWPSTNRDLGFTITDLADASTLLDTGIQTVLGTTPSVFNFDFSSTTGLQVTFLGDFFNGGVDNISYSATQIDDSGGPTDPSPIPLPASAFLLIGALGGLAAFRRRSRIS